MDSGAFPLRIHDSLASECPEARTACCQVHSRIREEIGEALTLVKIGQRSSCVDLAGGCSLKHSAPVEADLR
jgi:hypothetical protein